MERKIQIEITIEMEGSTIQQILSHKGFTSHQIRTLKFRERGICLNGMRQRVNCKVSSGDRLELLVDNGVLKEKPPIKQAGVGNEGFEGNNNTLEVLYEDQDLLIINKPAGMLSHAGRGHYKDTAADLVDDMLRRRGERFRPRVIGRLDKETSGVLVFARNQMAAARLSRQREEGRLKKTYVAMVQGVPLPLSGCVEFPIGKAAGALNRMEVRVTGKKAVTWYEVIRQGVDSSLVRFRLGTGRTHQIRVHMAALGHPLLYDSFYGSPVKDRMTALHACRVEFYQPFTGEKIEVAAPATRIEFKEQGYEL